MSFRAVLLDWRGTLVTTLDEEAWATEALRRPGREDDPEALADGLAKVADRLDAPGVDTDTDRHRRTYVEALSDLGLDEDLVEALYAVESDLCSRSAAAEGERVRHSVARRTHLTCEIPWRA